jgi:hypothetical protein
MHLWILLVPFFHGAHSYYFSPIELIGGLLARPTAHEITSLPGFNGTFPSRHYSGENANDKA